MTSFQAVKREAISLRYSWARRRWRRGRKCGGNAAERGQEPPGNPSPVERAGVPRPPRDPDTGVRIYRAPDIRDAQLAHLLRRGGYLFNHIATVLTELR
jgi:hypothetical protein